MDMQRLFSLEGRVALVTGAAYGIGFAMAEALAGAGAKIAFNCRGQEHLDKALAEYQAKGIDTPYEEVLADVKQRDYQDTHRAAAPLKQAEDAVLLDTSELDFEQSLDAMKQIIAKKIGG